MQITGKPDVDALVGISDAVMHGPRKCPLPGCKPGFFPQLTLRAQQTRLVCINLARREFDHGPAHRVPVLVFDQITAIRQTGHNHDGAGMLHIFPRGAFAIWQLHRVAQHPQEVAMQHLLPRHNPLCQVRWRRLKILR